MVVLSFLKEVSFFGGKGHYHGRFFIFYLYFWVFLKNHLFINFHGGSQLINHQFLQILRYEKKFIFMFVFWLFLQLLNNQFMPVLQRILGSSIEIFRQFWPFFQSLIIPDKFKELNILFRLPQSLLQLRVEVAVPVLLALFGISVNLVLIFIQPIQLLGDLFPLPNGISSGPTHLAKDYFFKKQWLLLQPSVIRQSYLFNAQPFEHTGLSRHSWNVRCNHPPVLVSLN